MDKDRQRLQRQSTEEIGKLLEARGYTVKVHGHRAIQIYKAGPPDSLGDTPKEWVGSMYWETKKGWRLDLAQPILYTNFDLDTALEEVDATQEAVRAADEAWAAYEGQRNDTNWQKYQGVMAAHQTRAFGRTWTKGTGF